MPHTKCWGRKKMIVGNGNPKNPPDNKKLRLEILHHCPEETDTEWSKNSSLLLTDACTTVSSTKSGQHLANKPPTKILKPANPPCCSCSRHAVCCTTSWCGRPICKCITAGRHCTSCKSFHIYCKNKLQAQSETKNNRLSTFTQDTSTTSCIVPTQSDLHTSTQLVINNNTDNEDATSTTYFHKPPTSHNITLPEHAQNNTDMDDSSSINSTTAKNHISHHLLTQNSTTLLVTVDKLLSQVYSSSCNNLDGTDDLANITDNLLWQQLWRKIAQQNTTIYHLPHGPVGRRFLTILSQEFKGVKERKWNSE